jgi:hypothetical protein
MRLRSPFRSGGDPGPSWAGEALEPLRRLEADCDVVPAVMARVRALQPAVAAAASPILPSRLAWRWSLVLGGATLVSLAVTLAVLILSGDEGSREALKATVSLGRLLMFAIELVCSLVIRIAAAGVPLLRGLLAIVQTASPVILGAGTLAAACGVLSIIYSSYVFAHARRTSPPARTHGGTR